MGLIHKCKACNYNTHVHASVGERVKYVCNGCGALNDFYIACDLTPPAASLVNESYDKEGAPFKEEELEGASKQYQSYLERELSFAGLHDWVLDPKIMEHMLSRKQGFVIDRTLTWEGLPEKSYQLVTQPLVYGVG